MIVPTGPIAKIRLENQARPIDTGIVFNGNVSIHVFANDPVLVERIASWFEKRGLPRKKRLIAPVRVSGFPFLWEMTKGKFLLLLETKNPMDAQRLANWLAQHGQEEETPKTTKKPVSLDDMADAGEIEVFDAG